MGFVETSKVMRAFIALICLAPEGLASSSGTSHIFCPSLSYTATDAFRRSTANNPTFRGIDTTDRWCQSQCSMYHASTTPISCPADKCKCSSPNETPQSTMCHSPRSCPSGVYVNIQNGNFNKKNWCQKNCKKGNCPCMLCKCGVAETDPNYVQEAKVSAKTRDDGRCGPRFGYAPCKRGACCSPLGWCGDTKYHCSDKVPVAAAADPGLPIRTDSRCGAGFANAPCRSGHCCSKWGFCGSTAAHCGTGCQFNCQTPPTISTSQTQTPRFDGRCGSGFGNAGCRDGFCCSRYGHCGKSAAHCGVGCQFGCSSSTGTTATTLATTTPTTTTTTTNAPNPTTTGGIRRDGWCGPKYGNASCPADACCTQYGYCLKHNQDAHDYCTAPKNCISGCTSPSTSTTSTPFVGPNPPRPELWCGSRYNNAGCPIDSCCTKQGQCLKTDQDVHGSCLQSAGCQFGCKAPHSGTSVSGATVVARPSNLPIRECSHFGGDLSNIKIKVNATTTWTIKTNRDIFRDNIFFRRGQWTTPSRFVSVIQERKRYWIIDVMADQIRSKELDTDTNILTDDLNQADVGYSYAPTSVSNGDLMYGDNRLTPSGMHYNGSHPAIQATWINGYTIIGQNPSNPNVWIRQTVTGFGMRMTTYPTESAARNTAGTSTYTADIPWKYGSRYSRNQSLFAHDTRVDSHTEIKPNGELYVNGRHLASGWWDSPGRYVAFVPEYSSRYWVAIIGHQGVSSQNVARTSDIQSVTNGNLASYEKMIISCNFQYKQ